MKKSLLILSTSGFVAALNPSHWVLLCAATVAIFELHFIRIEFRRHRLRKVRRALTERARKRLRLHTWDKVEALSYLGGEQA